MHEIVKNMSIFIFEEHPWNKRFQLEEKIFCAQLFSKKTLVYLYGVYLYFYLFTVVNVLWGERTVVHLKFHTKDLVKWAHLEWIFHTFPRTSCMLLFNGTFIPRYALISRFMFLWCISMESKIWELWKWLSWEHARKKLFRRYTYH